MGEIFVSIKIPFVLNDIFFMSLKIDKIKH